MHALCTALQVRHPCLQKLHPADSPPSLFHRGLRVRRWEDCHIIVHSHRLVSVRLRKSLLAHGRIETIAEPRQPKKQKSSSLFSFFFTQISPRFSAAANTRALPYQLSYYFLSNILYIHEQQTLAHTPGENMKYLVS